MVIQDEEQLVVAAEVRAAEYSESQLEDILSRVRSAVATYSGLSPYEVLLLVPRTIAKTTSGKISRSRVKAAYVEDTLQILARKVYGSVVNTMYVDAGDAGDAGEVVDSSAATEETSPQHLADEALLPSQVDHIDTVDASGRFDIVWTAWRGARERAAGGCVLPERHPVLLRVERRLAGDDVTGLVEASAAKEHSGAVLRSGYSCGAAL